MNNTSKHLETIKYIGGVLIVAAAGLIMFPGFLNVAAGVGRIILMIIIAGGACLALAYATLHFRRLREPTQAQPQTSPTNPTHETNS